MLRSEVRAMLLTVVVGGALVTGCRATRPLRPEARPLVGMFPTVYPASILDQSVAVRTDAAFLRRSLRSCGYGRKNWTQFMTDADLALAGRGLAGRGYAELDGRRVPGAELLWLVFRGVAGETDKTPTQLEIVGGFRATPFSLELGEPDSVWTDGDPYGRMQTTAEWRLAAGQGKAGTVRRITRRDGHRWILTHRLELPVGEGAGE